MIKLITITNPTDDSITIDITNPWETGFVIKEIDGLGPVEADTFFTDYATTDGAMDGGARVGARDIDISLLFQDDPTNENVGTIEDIRQKTYKYFPVKQTVKFQIETDNRIAEIEGRVTKNEPDIFNKKEGCSITISCPDPYFKKVGNPQMTRFDGVNPLFEFPFDNDSLDDKLIEMGEILQYSESNIVYEGDVPIGVTIEIHAIGAFTGFTIYNVVTRERISIDDARFASVMGSGIQTGDDIIIDTRRGHKGIKLIRNGRTYNILNVFAKHSDWFEITKGDNIFAYNVDSGLNNVQLKIFNEIAYSGV